MILVLLEICGFTAFLNPRALRGSESLIFHYCFVFLMEKHTLLTIAWGWGLRPYAPPNMYIGRYVDIEV